MSPARLTRLIELIGLLQTGRGYNATALSERFRVHRRTIFRDLEILRAAGVGVRFDQERQRFHIPKAYYQPPGGMTPDEALAVLVLCHELGDAGQLPFYEAAQSAVMKLEASLPSDVRPRLRALLASVQINLTPTSPPEGREHYRSLLEAITDRRCVRVEYQSLSGEGLVSTRLNPYRLLFSRHAWYVIARSSIHRDTRTFHVGRVRKLEVLEEKFRYPAGFNVDRYLRNAWHLIPEPGVDREIHLRFSAKVARNVAEVQWHRTQRTELRDDGTLDFRVTVSGIGEIAWWILGYGPEALVIAPGELRELIADRARQTAERYASA